VELTEKHRPKTFEEVIGQELAVKKIQTKARNGYGGLRYWIAGKSGQGKTSLARIMASLFGGMVTEYDSADQFTKSEFNQLSQSFRMSSMFRHTIIINESHGMRAPIVRQMLGLMERMPKWALIIFTTTLDGEDLFSEQMDSGPFASRVTEIHLAQRGLAGKMALRCQKIARAEGLDGKPIKAYEKLLYDCGSNMRKALEKIDAGEMQD